MRPPRWPLHVDLTQPYRGCCATRSGPSFKRGRTFGEMQNVDIYALCCKLLGIDPAPNNGTLSRMSPMLLDS